jgi:hypothetical protein
MGVRRRSIWLPWLFWLLSAGAGADEQPRFAISQVSFQQPVITAYLDIRGQNGQIPANVAVSDLSAKLQGQPLKVARVTSFDASGEGVAYLFLLDVSKSVTVPQFTQNQQFIKKWIDALGPADRLELATFGTDYHQEVDFTADKSKLESSLATLKPTDKETRLYVALKNAASLGQRAETGLPGRRVIVVLSDGFDEGSDIGEDDLLNTLKQSHVPVYALGASHLRAPYRQRGLEALNRIASSSQGLFWDASAKPPAALSADLKAAVGSVFVASLNCDSCRPAAQAQPLEISLSGAVPSTIPVDLALTPPANPGAGGTSLQPPGLPELPWWQLVWNLVWSKLGLALLIIVLIAAAIFWILRRKKRPENLVSVVPQKESRKPEPPPPPSPAPGGGGLPLRFTAVAGKESGREYRLNLLGRLVVGRDQGCDLPLPEDTEVSGQHCELTLAGRAIELADLKSRNGTLLNGARVAARRRLESGDLIRVGRTELRVTFEESK